MRTFAVVMMFALTFTISASAEMVKGGSGFVAEEPAAVPLESILDGAAAGGAPVPVSQVGSGGGDALIPSPSAKSARSSGVRNGGASASSSSRAAASATATVHVTQQMIQVIRKGGSARGSSSRPVTSGASKQQAPPVVNNYLPAAQPPVIFLNTTTPASAPATTPPAVPAKEKRPVTALIVALFIIGGAIIALAAVGIPVIAGALNNARANNRPRGMVDPNRQPTATFNPHQPVCSAYPAYADHDSASLTVVPGDVLAASYAAYNARVAAAVMIANGGGQADATVWNNFQPQPPQTAPQPNPQPQAL